MIMRTRVVLAGLVGAVALSAACGGAPGTPAPGPAPAAQAPAGPRFDVVIANGRVVDGTGAPWFVADVGITGDRITAIGNLSTAEAATRIDAAGQVVAPGFIDLLGQSEFNVLVDSRVASKITQGITTEITGEGVSIAPVNDQMVADRKASYEFFKVPQDFRTLAEYFTKLETAKSAVNLGTFVGSGGLRDYVIGKADRVATADEIAKMQALVAQAMADGALGVSSSLQYIPNRFSTTDELVALAKTAAASGGIYITHQRSEGNKVFESVRGGAHHRRAGQHPGRDLAPEDGLQGQLGQDAGSAAPHRGGACEGAARLGQHLSLRPRLERARCLPAGVGARGRHRRRC